MSSARSSALICMSRQRSVGGYRSLESIADSLPGNDVIRGTAPVHQKQMIQRSRRAQTWLRSSNSKCHQHSGIARQTGSCLLDGRSPAIRDLGAKNRGNEPKESRNRGGSEANRPIDSLFERPYPAAGGARCGNANGPRGRSRIKQRNGNPS
uniref:Integron gene cassette protein n=1 Tax=Steinernema glaseri TaxID=37863 RepID=A0A1I7YV46_9BILA